MAPPRACAEGLTLHRPTASLALLSPLRPQGHYQSNQIRNINVYAKCQRPTTNYQFADLPFVGGEWRTAMPRFYFNLYARDECFGDDVVGNDLADLAAAHSRAKQFARRIMTFSGLSDHEPDWRHWLVKVKDDRHLTVLTVIFPNIFVPPEWRFDAETNRVRALQRALSAIRKEIRAQ
jgi:hypothetical protein